MSNPLAFQRRGQRRSELIPLSTVLHSVAGELGIPDVDTARLIDPSWWKEHVGEDLAFAGLPSHFRNGVLTVIAENELGAARLQLSSAAIVTILNEALGRSVVVRLVVQRS